MAKVAESGGLQTRTLPRATFLKKRHIIERFQGFYACPTFDTRGTSSRYFDTFFVGNCRQKTERFRSGFPAPLRPGRAPSCSRSVGRCARHAFRAPWPGRWCITGPLKQALKKRSQNRAAVVH